MKQIKPERIKILYVETIEIALLDIPRALDELGYNVYKASLEVRAQGFDKEASDRVIHAIDEFQIQCAISYDFSESIAQACLETGIPYISWVYDAPQQELYTHYAMYPCNYVFVFDDMQQKRLTQIGMKNVYHISLAVHEQKVKIALKRGEKSKREYISDIAFVGQLYRLKNLENIVKSANNNIQNAIEENIQSCYLKWDDTIHMHGSMNEECVRYFSGIDQHKIPGKYPYITEQFYYEAAVLSRLIANRERVFILNSLAEKYQVDFYTFDKDTSQLNENVNIKAGAKYDYEVSNIYHDSKINLNITLHCIETGASQRIFDVMAAGGFMLSNYQRELAELFVPGEEIVLYHNMKELEYYVEYYLIHEKERERIAKNGQKKVLQKHSFHKKMKQVMELVIEKESTRESSYIVEQRQWLIKKADEYLAVKTEEFYRRLYEIFANQIYRTTIQKTTELGILFEMLECFRMEWENGDSNIFTDVESLEEASRKYLRIKHGMWRIEQELSEESCTEVIEMLKQEDVSRLLIGWIIFANLRDRDKVFARLSCYMREYSMADAIELLTYGLFWMPGNGTIALHRADCFMELNMWKEALVSLKAIETPGTEIKGMIYELEQALQVENR